MKAVWWPLLLSLGLDNLLLSAAVGASGLRRPWRIALWFALFEAAMPALGLAAGGAAAAWIGAWGFWLGIAVLAGLGLFIVIADDGDEEHALARKRGAWGWIAAGVAVSTDELLAGVSFGLLHFPPGLTVLFIALQALLVSALGIWIGRKLTGRLGERWEKAVGYVMLAAAAWLALSRLL